MDISALIPLAKSGDISACNQVGDYYYDCGDYKQAMEYFSIAAQKNDSEGLYSLAYCYLYESYDNDASKGVFYLTKAAELNHPKACRILGFLYFYGEKNLPQNDDLSFRYIKKAAELGDAAAQSHLGQCYKDGIWGAPEENHALAKHYFDLALAQNYNHAQWCVGMNYKTGRCGYPQSYEKAFHYFKLSAENGCDKGQFDLAICYWNGQGTPENHREALKYMEMAAEQGHVEAMSRIGGALFFGVEYPVTDSNIARGREYLKKAAAKGDKNAKETLEEIAEEERLHGPISAAKVKGGPTQTSKQSNGGGCYVATAVYGSYDCPQVWTLRRFRDFTLAETWYGRAFIHIYYAVSPTLVKWFGHTVWFKALWKKALDRMVLRLQNTGIAATPYQDRSW